MEGLVLSSSSSSIGGCVVFRRRVTHTHTPTTTTTTTTNNRKCLLFQQTNKNNLKFNNKNHFQRGPSVVVALSGNTQEPQQEQEDEDEDEDEDNNEQEEDPLASFVALSANPEDEDEDDQVDTKPIHQQLVSPAAAALSTPLKLIFKWLLNQFSSFLKKDQPTTTTNSSQHGTTTSTRAGLFRTPISGGVQSATSVHDLPPPPLAVRNLMEQARFAHLCTVMSRMHHRREGYPFGSLVDFATDAMGHPIFSFSPLAIHTRNLLADPRCTLVVQIPGWSGLSNARVTIFGDVFPLPEDQQEWAHQLYIAKHHQGPSHKWGNFYYFRMQNISDIYFIGGFGTVAWVNVSEYEALRPDKIAVDGGEQNLKELNAIFSKPIKELLSLETEVDDAALISIDSKGTDVRVRQGAQFNIQRLAFEEGHGVETLEEAKAALWNLIHKGGGLKLDHKF